MKKHLLIMLAAGLLLLSVTACKKDPADIETTPDDNAETTSTYIPVNPDTDTDVDTGAATDPDETTVGEVETKPDPSEENPTFADVNKEVVIVSSVATVRTSTQIPASNDNAIGWPKEGKVLTVTGESENWYRIKYTVNGAEQDCYIAKSVVGDVTIFDTFTAVEGGETLIEVITTSLNVRSYPSADYDVAVRYTLLEGAQVKCIATNDNWCRILYEVVSETETNADGSKVVEIKEYYVSKSDKYIKFVETETTAEETTAEETTVAAN